MALARIDLKRTALSAEIQINWMPRALGSMMLRPGWEFIDSTRNNAQAVHIPFVYSLDDTAIIEITDSIMRVRVDEEIIERTQIATNVANGTFASNLTSWTSADEAGASSVWVTGGYLGLTGTRFNAAVRTQQVSVAFIDQNVEHALRIVVTRGPVIIRVGSSSGADDYIAETSLRTGTYSLAFTPTGDFFIKLSNRAQYQTLVDSIQVEGAGDMEITVPWSEDDLKYVRRDQSGDVVFVACDGVQQKRIERHASRSWAVVNYEPEDGPFRLPNTGSVRLTPSGLTGNITLTASASLFRTGHVGALFRITSTGQNVSISVNGANQFSDPIRVTGVGGSRIFTVTRSGTYVASQITLQRSVGEIGAWENTGTVFTTNGTTSINDGQDNQIIYYRVGIVTGSYTSGTAVLSLSYSAGGITGRVRITGYSSATSATAAVLSPLGSTAASDLWSEGQWSDYRGWPSAVAFYEGRLWWAGKDKVNGSVSDAFESFDDAVLGDSAPVSRSIGSGPVDRVNWLLPLLRMIVGTQLSERSARSSSLDEPLTATNFNLKSPSTRGSSPVQALVLDSSGIFVRNDRMFQLSYQGDVYVDYTSEDLTIIAPEVGTSGFVKTALQRYPDTRIHAIRNNGMASVLVYDSAEEVKCWVEVETEGTVEDVFVLPGEEGSAEDRVYYVVNRTINGLTKRYLEKWALESECVGGALNKQADSFITYTGASTATITGLDHLEGEEVIAWGDGVNYSPLDEDGNPTTFTVSGGIITLPAVVTNAVVGSFYEATYKSTKLAYGAGLGTALTQPKRVSHLGLIMANTHAKGLRYGPDFDILDDLPEIENGALVNPDYIWESYDEESIEFPGEWNTDSRICLKAAAPTPCTILAAVVSIETHDKV